MHIHPACAWMSAKVNTLLIQTDTATTVSTASISIYLSVFQLSVLRDHLILRHCLTLRPTSNSRPILCKCESSSYRGKELIRRFLSIPGGWKRLGARSFQIKPFCKSLWCADSPYHCCPLLPWERHKSPRPETAAEPTSRKDLWLTVTSDLIKLHSGPFITPL